jgi:hypothetical protein
MRALPALILAMSSLVLAAPAQAGFVTFGSDLSKTPTIEHSTPNDSVFFNDALVGGNGVDIDVTGQVVKVEMKGRIVPSRQTLAGGGDPFNVVHFQVIKPSGGGAWSVPKYGTSADYRMPWTGPDDQVNTWDTKGDALCVRPGYRLDFATLGGFDYANGYNDGTPFRVFAAAPGARVLQYAANGTDGVQNETTFTPQSSRDGEELLMRYVVATGTDARYACQDAATQQGGSGGGGTTTPSTPKATGLTLPRKQKPRVALRWRLPIAGFCHATGTCRGTMTVTAKGKKIGSKRFAVGGHKSDGIKVTLNKLGRKLFKRSRKRLKVTITAVTAPGGTSNTDSLTVVITSRY